MKNQEQRDAKEQRELARRKKQLNAKTLKYGLILTLVALFLAGAVDEVTSCINVQVQSSVVTEFFVRPGNLPYNEAMAKFSAVKLISYVLMLLVPFYKSLADRFGRKPFLVFNTVGMGVGLLLAFLSPNVIVYFIGFGIMQFFIMHDMQIVYLYEVAPKEKRATIYGMIKGISSLSIVLIPILRAAVMGDDADRWRGVYLFPAMIAIAVSVFTFIITRESKAFLTQRIEYLEQPYDKRHPAKKLKSEKKTAAQHKAGVFRAIGHLWKNKQLMWLTIVNVVFAIGSTTIAGYAESIMTDFGMTAGQVTKALFFYPFFYAALLWGGGVIGDKFGRKTIVSVAGFIALFGFICFNFSAYLGLSPYLVGVFYGSYLGCWWLTTDYVSMMVAESAPTYNRASVLGAVGLITLVGHVLGQIVPIGASLLFERIGFGYMTVVVPFVVIGVILVRWKIKETKGVDLSEVAYEEEA